MKLHRQEIELAYNAWCEQDDLCFIDRDEADAHVMETGHPVLALISFRCETTREPDDESNTLGGESTTR